MIKLPENPETAFNVYCLVKYLRELEEGREALRAVNKEMICLHAHANFLKRYDETPNPSVRETFDEIKTISNKAIEKQFHKREAILAQLCSDELCMEHHSKILQAAGMVINDKCFRIYMAYSNSAEVREIDAFITRVIKASKSLSYSTYGDLVTIRFPGTIEAKNEAFEALKKANNAGFRIWLGDEDFELEDFPVGDKTYTEFCEKHFDGLDCFARNYRAFEPLSSVFDAPMMGGNDKVEAALFDQLIAAKKDIYEAVYQKMKARTLGEPGNPSPGS